MGEKKKTGRREVFPFPALGAGRRKVFPLPALGAGRRKVFPLGVLHPPAVRKK
jgi:hypothetical protein